MQVKLKMNAVRFASRPVNQQKEHYEALEKYLTAKAGQWIEIDTTYLSDNQYNSKDGYKILDQYITEVKDDARPGKIRCNYCGATLPAILKDEHIEYCIEKAQRSAEKYGYNFDPTDHARYIETFTPKNTFFLNTPILPALQNIEAAPREKFGTYYFYTLNDMHHVIHNSRQTLKFLYDPDRHEYIDLTYSVGYNRKKSLPIPEAANKKLLQFLREQYATAAAPAIQ